MKLTLTTDDGTVLGTWELVEYPHDENDKPIRPQGEQDVADGIDPVLEEVRSDVLKLWRQLETVRLHKKAMQGGRS